MTTKHIPIEHLTVGMYVVGLDKSWLHSPFLFSSRRIKRQEDIARLKAYGIRQVTIDPARGADLPTAPPMPEPSSPPVKEIPCASDLSPTNEEIVAHGALPQELAAARAVRAEAMTAIQGIFEGVKTGVPIQHEQVQQVVTTLLQHTLRYHDPLISLIHMRDFEANMFTHAINVCVFALVIGKIHALDVAQLESLGMGALLHDVGELRLPQNLLRKQTVYTVQERRLMQEHPKLGLALLAPSRDVPEAARRVIMGHHERVDGSGYPQGLRDTEVDLLSQIVGIADIYDAMFSNRGWRPPLSPAQAVKELYQYGMQGQFERDCIERAIRCLGIYPIGSLVELNTGERGLVITTNPLDALRPSVNVVWSHAREPYPAPFVVDLALPPAAGAPPRTILRVLDPGKERLNVSRYLAEGV